MRPSRASRPRRLQRLIGRHQPLARPRQRRTDRPERQPERLGDLLVIQPFFSHQQSQPVPFGQRVDRLPRHRGLLRPLERRLGLVNLPLAGLGRQQRQPPPAPNVPPRFVAHEIRRDREQPGALVRERRLPQRADERLLRDLLRPIPIAQAPREIPHERHVIGSEQPVGVVHVSKPYQSERTDATSASVNLSAPSPATSIATARPATRTASPTENAVRRSGTALSSAKYAAEYGLTFTTRMPSCHRESTHTESFFQNVRPPACCSCFLATGPVESAYANVVASRAMDADFAAWKAATGAEAGCADPVTAIWLSCGPFMARISLRAASDTSGSCTRYEVRSVGIPNRMPSCRISSSTSGFAPCLWRSALKYPMRCVAQRRATNGLARSRSGNVTVCVHSTGPAAV